MKAKGLSNCLKDHQQLSTILILNVSKSDFIVNSGMDWSM